MERITWEYNHWTNTHKHFNKDLCLAKIKRFLNWFDGCIAGSFIYTLLSRRQSRASVPNRQYSRFEIFHGKFPWSCTIWYPLFALFDTTQLELSSQNWPIEMPFNDRPYLWIDPPTRMMLPTRAYVYHVFESDTTFLVKAWLESRMFQCHEQWL